MVNVYLSQLAYKWLQTATKKRDLLHVWIKYLQHHPKCVHLWMKLTEVQIYTEMIFLTQLNLLQVIKWKYNITDSVYSVCNKYLCLEYLVLVISDETASEVKSIVNSTFDTQMGNQTINMNKGIWQLYIIVEAYLTFTMSSTRTPKELMYIIIEDLGCNKIEK